MNLIHTADMQITEQVEGGDSGRLSLEQMTDEMQNRKLQFRELIGDFVPRPVKEGRANAIDYYATEG